MKHLIRYYIINAIQLVTLLVISLSIIVVDSAGGVAFFLGGSVAVTSYFWFSYRAISKGQVRASTVMVVAANRGAIEKYFLSAAGFACIFVIYEPDNPLLVFGGYITILFIQIVGVVLLSQRPTN